LAVVEAKKKREGRVPPLQRERESKSEEKD